MSSKHKKHTIIITTTVSALLLLVSNFFSSKHSSEQETLLMEAVGVANLGVNATKQQSTLAYNQDAVFEICKNYGYESDRCKDAFKTQEKNRTSVLQDSETYKDSWSSFSEEIKSRRLVYWWNYEFLESLFLILAFLLTLLTGILEYISLSKLDKSLVHVRGSGYKKRKKN